MTGVVMAGPTNNFPIAMVDDADLWKIFSGETERSTRARDQWGRPLYHGRAVSEVSHAVVSQRLYQNGFRPHYPGGGNFAVCISHDVDHLFLSEFTTYARLKQAGKELLAGNLKRTLRYLNQQDPINPYYNVDELLEMEAKLGILSTFYFMALQPGEPDYNYSLPTIRPLLRAIARAGCEIGLHGGHLSFSHDAKLQEEKNELGRNSPLSIIGFRNHFLRFKVPETWQSLAGAGFSYDTTFGFPDHPGFRNGMCYPFFPFDLKEKRFLDVLEIPLIAMDATFIYYLKYDVRKSFEILKQIVDKIRSVNGAFTLLWHNNYLYEPWSTLFCSIVSYCKDSGGWFTTGEGLNNWWRKNNFCGQYESCGLFERS